MSTANATAVGVHLYNQERPISLTLVAEPASFACIRLTDEAAIYVHDPAILDRLAKVFAEAACQLREARRPEPVYARHCVCDECKAGHA